MKTGTLILALHDSPGMIKVAEQAKAYLESKGRKNVFIGVHHGSPDCYKVFLQMNAEGVDTYCILPLAVFEGNETVWNMPKHLTLPDNCGSWTMIGEHDVATRFSTSMGAHPAILTAVFRSIENLPTDTGIILACRGSKLSFPRKSLEYYSSYISESGWKTSTAFCSTDLDSIIRAETELREKGCSRTHIVPFFIDGSSKSLARSLEKLTLPFSVGQAVSEYEEFYELLDSKVPEDW